MLDFGNQPKRHFNKAELARGSQRFELSSRLH